MKKTLSHPFIWSLAALLYSAPAFAQDSEDPTEEPTEEPTSEPAEPSAAKPAEEIIIVNQRKPFLHTQRSEVMAFAGATANDPFLVHYAAGGAFNYYFSDVLAVGVQAMKYFETNTGLSADVIGLGAVPDLNRLDFYGGAHFSYVPVYGKFALFNQAVVGFDTYVTLGAGLTGNRLLAPFAYAQTISNEQDLAEFCGLTPGNGFTGDGAFCEDSEGDGVFDNAGNLKPIFLSLSPSFGAGFRFFLNDFMSLTFDAKDFFILETTLSGKNILAQNVVISVGTSFFFPTTFTYQAPR